ncbi:MAG: TIGR00730 family Rossman fold protein [Candidatus Babeliales bacterium]|jgi:uncharacterized protein (TIGR00730 family)
MQQYIRALGATVRLAGHFFCDFFRCVRGTFTISKLEGPVVSIFGGSKLGQDHPYAQKARLLAEKLMVHDISVITGGGQGIMQAASCGAFGAHNNRIAKSIAVTVKGLDQEKRNNCADESIETFYFFTRKFLLTRYSHAFAVFPGGYGTLDELAEVLTLMQINKLPRVPLVLFEAAYWKHFSAWVDQAQKEGLLLKEDADLIFVTDDVEQAFNHLHKHCKHVAS